MRRAAGALTAVAALAAALAAPASAAQDQAQRFFAQKLIADERTAEPIRDLLATGGGFVDRSIAFRDLTGDDRAEAIVRVQSNGAAGVVAVYVFSAHRRRGEGRELRAIFRSQSLRRASTRVAEGALRYRYGRFADGDQVCCPAQEIEATLRWDEDKGRLVVAERTTVAATPTPTPTPTPTTP
jgi:hypothetical protein